MSIRTLIEINHDRIHSIEKDPEGFTKDLLQALRSGGTCKSKDVHGFHSRLRSYGANVKHIRHHSDDCPTGVVT